MSEVTLFFDTETTGLVDFKLPFSHPSQPRVIQLAAILSKGETVLGTLSSLIIPAGFEISPEMTKIHGKTTDDCKRYGHLAETIFHAFKSWVSVADVLVGHNISFDIGMMKIEYSKLIGYDIFEGKKTYCTKMSSTNVCKIPNPRGGYKWPRLKEVYKYAFGVEPEDQHDALGDVRSTKKVYEWLIKQKGN